MEDAHSSWEAAAGLDQSAADLFAGTLLDSVVAAQLTSGVPLDRRFSA
jgi:hypothetical protein